MQKQPNLSITNNSITAVFEVNLPPLVIKMGSSLFDEALKCIQNRDWAGLKECFSCLNMVKKYSHGNIVVSNDNKVYYKNKEIYNYAAKRLQEMVAYNLPIESFIIFLNNVMESEQEYIKDELLKFLEHSGSPITEDGCFLAYRRVDSNYKSFHASPDGTYNINTVGTTIRMNKNEVDFNRENHCSKGLHFCGFSYLSHYYDGSGKIMIVKINPKNVACFPTDYKYAKGRCIEYTVVGELENNTTAVQTNILKDKMLFKITESGIRYWNCRDSSGKFVKKA